MDTLVNETEQSTPFSAPSIQSAQPEPPRASSPSRWIGILSAFSDTHKVPLNVFLHTLTTPLCLFGSLSILASLSLWGVLIAVTLYAVSLIHFLPRKVTLLSTVVLVALTALAIILDIGWLAGLACFAFGYLGQEAAHWLTEEPTLQSTYQGSRGWLWQLIEHTYFLLPLLIATAHRGAGVWFGPFVARQSVLKTVLTDGQDRADLEGIREWVDLSHPTVEQSIHFWQHQMPSQASSAFQRLSESRTLIEYIKQFHGLGYDVEPVYEMNELYVTGPVKKMTSDTVFYMPHVDGPWSVFPFATVYRCMVAASPNDRVHTHFPMLGTDYRTAPSYTLTFGDALAFDFNQELHFITRSTGVLPPCNRVNLKLHFVAYPKWLRPYGRLLARLTTWYDISARELFLDTIKPTTVWQKFKAFQVLATTKAFEWGTRHLGWTNLSFLFLIATISVVAGSLALFIAATSFVHYLIYLGTMAERGAISFGHFVRDAVFFKIVAMINLAILTVFYFDPSPLSWLLIAVGFGIAAWSAIVLGRSRTYYGEELGLLEPKRILHGPYRFLPHPMILGAAIGMLGIWLNHNLRADYPWLIPTHLALYALVLWQEIRNYRTINPH